jgi:cell wall-associated NlpC family hydrolase
MSKRLLQWAKALVALLTIMGALLIGQTAQAAVPQSSAPITAPMYVGGSVSAQIAAAAYAQVGASQDCTVLVTNSLAAAGIQFHDWPGGYTSLGYAVSPSQAVPGDLVYYDNGGAGVPHIAV